MRRDLPPAAPPDHPSAQRPPTLREVTQLLDELTVRLQAPPAARQGAISAPVAPEVARAALDRLARLYSAYGEQLRRERAQSPDPVTAALLGRQAWVWWVTGLRLREIGPRRARRVVLARLRERIGTEGEIAGSLLLAADLLEAVLDLLDHATSTPTPP